MMTSGWRWGGEGQVACPRSCDQLVTELGLDPGPLTAPLVLSPSALPYFLSWLWRHYLEEWWCWPETRLIVWLSILRKTFICISLSSSEPPLYLSDHHSSTLPCSPACGRKVVLMFGSPAPLQPISYQLRSHIGHLGSYSRCLISLKVIVSRICK